MPRSLSPVRAADVTRIMRGLFPAPVSLTTRETGPGRFTVLLPVASATEWGVGNPVGRARAALWLTRHLGAPVTITDARIRPGRTAKGGRRRAAVDLAVGEDQARPGTGPTCSTCGGRATRSSVLSAHPDPERRPWVHLYREDWQDNPHDVTIAAEGDDRPAADTVRDTDGTVLRGPSLPCGCPLDSGCTGYHPGRLP